MKKQKAKIEPNPIKLELHAHGLDLRLPDQRFNQRLAAHTNVCEVCQSLFTALHAIYYALTGHLDQTAFRTRQGRLLLRQIKNYKTLGSAIEDKLKAANKSHRK